MSKLLCINDLIRFMIKEEEKLMNGSEISSDLNSSRVNGGDYVVEEGGIYEGGVYFSVLYRFLIYKVENGG